jgi:hypothetical protein
MQERADASPTEIAASSVTLTVDFGITITGEIEITLDGSLLRLKIKVNSSDEGSKPSFGTMNVPLSFFPNAQQAFAVMRETPELFKDKLESALVPETMLHFGDVAGRVLMGYDPKLEDKKEIIADHLNKTAKRLKKAFDVPTKGQPSEWNARELTLAIKGIVKDLPKQLRTYDKVAKEMQKDYADIAPASGEALRKLVERFDLNWRELKSGH